MKNYKRSISKFLRTHKQALFTGWLFLIAIALLFGIFSQFQPPAVTKPFPEGVRVVDYSTFVGQVKAGNVLAVIMQGDDIHSLLVQPFLVYSSSSSTGVAGSSQRDATDIATWNRYVTAGYTDLSRMGIRAAQSHKPSAPPIDLQRALYTHMPESGDASLMPLLLSKHVVVNTLPVTPSSIWLGLLWKGILVLGLLLLWLQMFTTRAATRSHGSLDARVTHNGQRRIQRFERVQETSKPRLKVKKATSMNEVQGSLEAGVTFADVAGIDEVRVELEEIVRFLRNPECFRHLGARIPRGVLLAGPPGTGKTLLAKAVAGEAGVAFLSMSASEFVEKFVGVGASRVRKLFEQARQSAPCIIFIDELDAVGRQRSMQLTSNDERDQTLNQLLVELDGFDSCKAVIVMAATNRVDMLDKALLRPGRFDRHITVSLPDRAGREAILKVHTRRTPLHEDVSLELLSRLTTGMSGADLANLVNEAALLAARQNLDCLTCQCFEDALARVQLGALRPLLMNEEDKRIIAFHEGGHALVAYHLPHADSVNRVTILPRGQSLGVTQFAAGEDRYNYSRETLMARIAVGLGGRAAEELVFGAERVTTGAENDLQVVTELARRMVTRWGMSEQLGVVFADGEPGRMSLNMSRGDANQLPLQARSLLVDANGHLLLNGDERIAYQYTTSMAATYKGSMSMAALIDAEVQGILKEGYTMARTVLREHAEQLTRLADALMEREQLDRVQFERLLKAE